MSELASPIKAEHYPLKDIFSDRFLFTIPLFQRPFSWTKDHFEKLFMDIYDAMKASKDKKGIYFLGSMVFVNEKGNYYQVIDGQQRLVSLIVLMAVARDLIKDEDYKHTLQGLIYQKEDRLLRKPKAERLKPWEELEEYFANYIYAENGTINFLDDCKGKLRDKIKNDEDNPVYHLYEAVTTFHEKFKDLFSGFNREEELISYIEFLLNNVYVVAIRTLDMASAIRLFNVLNTRGLPLSSVDIIKGINLEVISDKELRDKYAKRWIELERELSREELEKLISFIRTVYAKDKARVSLHEEFEKLYREKKIEKGERFFDLVGEFAEIYEKRILKPEIDDLDHRRRNKYRILVSLMRDYLPFSEWIPPVLTYCKKFVEEKLFDFIVHLERKTFIEWAAGFTVSERITSFSRVIQAIEDSKSPDDAIVKMFLYKPLREQKARYIDFYNTQEIRKILRSILDHEQFYKLKGGKLAKYVLLRLDMELWDLAVFPGYSGPITVEHILPVTPPENSEWVKIFDNETREKWTHKLGNLILLSGYKNSKAGNFDFAKKIEVYVMKRCSPFRLTQKFVEDFHEWNLDNLKRRHESLIEEIIKLYVQPAPNQTTLM